MRTTKALKPLAALDKKASCIPQITLNDADDSSDTVQLTIRQRARANKKVYKKRHDEAQKDALSAVIQAKKMNHCEAVWDAHRRNGVAAGLLQGWSTSQACTAWSFLGDSPTMEISTASASSASTTQRLVVVDATTRASTDCTSRGESVAWHAPLGTPPASAADWMCWRGDRNRPRRATSAVSQAKVASAVDALIGNASTRRASSTGRAAGAAMSRISRRG